MSKGMRTEDEVRDSAKLVLGFDKTEDGVQQGTGQITTFNQLGFRGCNDKPDGWYLPDDASKPAIILETKSETEGVSKEKHVKELFKNIDVVAKKYSKTIGILYSGSAIRVFRNKIELSDASKRLENKDYYICLVYEPEARQQLHLRNHAENQQQPAFQVRYDGPAGPDDFHGLRPCRPALQPSERSSKAEGHGLQYLP